jgi:CoA-transferase family III
MLASCQPDLAAEWQYLTGWLPPDVLSGTCVSGSAGSATPVSAGAAECALLAWARSGLMDITGPQAGPPAAPAAPVLARAALLIRAIAILSAGKGNPLRLNPSRVLGYRAAESGFRRQGTVSANGSCRLLPAADGWLAVNLARDTDVRSVPAVLGRELAGDLWAELTEHVAVRPAAEVAIAAQSVGIPAAELGTTPARPVRFGRLGEAGPAPRLVLDLSAMWAGPLCANILHRSGWRVLKVEDTRRPDGARFGPQRFYADLHGSIPAVRLDFGSQHGRSELSRLAGLAGMVVDSSRPRALGELGLVAEDWLRGAPGRVWISVTGYGRDDPRQRVAFGDDAAVAGGLVALAPDGTPVFCGDAIADPLTGLHAGLAALAAHVVGGGFLVDAAMAGVSADVARPASGPAVAHVVSGVGQSWTVSHGPHSEIVQPVGHR